MDKVKETLWSDYNKVTDLIGITNGNDEKYKILLDERDKIRNELIKCEQAEIETNLKRTQIEAENKRDKIRNQITIGTFIVTTSVSVYAIVKTFRFDQDSTVTSTLGRNILNGVIPKMFKR